LAKLPNLDDDELQSTLRELGQLEQQVSQQRRELHQVIDRMEADLTARHKVRQA
jgi:RsiG-like